LLLSSFWRKLIRVPYTTGNKEAVNVCINHKAVALALDQLEKYAQDVELSASTCKFLAALLLHSKLSSGRERRWSR
jgi:hypothetical protein